MSTGEDMKRPLFSVVVPTYDRQAYLREAVSSVLAQTVESFECIVVDDGSPQPQTVVDDPRIKLIRRSVNGGLAAARNTGIAQSRGKYLAFLDDDDMFTPDRLEIAAKGLEQAALAICWSTFMGETVGRQRRLNGNVHDTILNKTTPPIGAVAIERERAPLFDEEYLASQDLEWWLRVTRDVQVATVPQVGYMIRKHSGPRNLNGPRARVQFSRRLLRDESDYFASHRRAAAFRWKRIGLMSASLGDPNAARASFARSVAIYPTPGALKHLLRVWVRRDSITRR